MKKALLIILSLAMVLCFVACGTNDSNTNTNTNSVYVPSETGLSKEEALEEAKQEVVNKICQANNVHRITISYGTEEIYKDSFGDWRVELKGTYRTVNDYGETDYSGDRKNFSYSGTVFAGGWASMSGSCK